MIVTDIVTVLGCGNVIVCDDKAELKDKHVGDKVVINETKFEIKDIESCTHMKSCGLVLCPNSIVKDVVHVNDTVTIFKDS